MNLTVDDLMNFLIDRKSPDNQSTLFIEDDGRVAYAYLQVRTSIVSDVWLYNRSKAPVKPEWPNRTKMPFTNPIDYCVENDLGAIESPDDVRVHWDGEEVHVIIHDVLWAILRSGDKPGRCRLASKDGPLARIMLNKNEYS